VIRGLRTPRRRGLRASAYQLKAHAWNTPALAGPDRVYRASCYRTAGGHSCHHSIDRQPRELQTHALNGSATVAVMRRVGCRRVRCAIVFASDHGCELIGVEGLADLTGLSNRAIQRKLRRLIAADPRLFKSIMDGDGRIVAIHGVMDGRRSALVTVSWRSAQVDQADPDVQLNQKRPARRQAVRGLAKFFGGVAAGVLAKIVSGLITDAMHR
jgi:hypothetical protein